MVFLAFALFSCNSTDDEIISPNDEVYYDYSLIDINISSISYGQNIGPDYFEQQVTVHYFGHQNWGTCTARVGQLNELYENLISEGTYDVKIIAIGKGQYIADNLYWTLGHSIPVVVDPSPNTLWTEWAASQRDLFFLDSNGNYITDFNISEWDYNAIYNQIQALLPE